MRFMMRMCGSWRLSVAIKTEQYAKLKVADSDVVIQDFSSKWAAGTSSPIEMRITMVRLIPMLVSDKFPSSLTSRKAK